MAGTDRETDLRGEPDEHGYRPLTDRGVKVLAEAARSGRIFGSWCLPVEDKSLLHMVFMPIGLGVAMELPKSFLDGVAHVYEWVDEGGPIGINGLPTFFSVRFLTRDDWTRLCARIQAVEKAIADLDEGATKQ